MDQSAEDTSCKLSGREYAILSPAKEQLVGVALLLLVVSLGCQKADHPAAPAPEPDSVSTEELLLSDSPPVVATTSASPNTARPELNTSKGGQIQQSIEEEQLPSPLVNEIRQAVNDYVEEARAQVMYHRHVQMLSRILLKPTDEQEALLAGLWHHCEEYLAATEALRRRNCSRRETILTLENTLFAMFTDGDLSDPRIRELWNEIHQYDYARRSEPWEYDYRGECPVLEQVKQHLFSNALTKADLFLMLAAIRFGDVAGEGMVQQNKNIDEFFGLLPDQVLAKARIRGMGLYKNGSVHYETEYPISGFDSIEESHLKASGVYQPKFSTLFKRLVNLNLARQEFLSYFAMLNEGHPGGNALAEKSKHSGPHLLLPPGSSWSRGESLTMSRQRAGSKACCLSNPSPNSGGSIVVLSIQPMPIGNRDYYLKMAREGYYFLGNLAPGTWIGRGSRQLGLVGQVEPEAFHNVFSGFSPDGTRRLVQPQNYTDGRTSQDGWDLTFSSPKSLSIAFAVADEETRRAIQDIHFRAVKQAISYLENNAAFTRRGQGGTVLEAVDLVVAAFQEATSREGDPQLHIHCTVAKLNPSGGSISSMHLYMHKMAAGCLYRAALSSLLWRELGLRSSRVDSWFELDGVPKKLIDEFSKRRQQVIERLDKLGLKGPVAAADAAQRTRKNKSQLSPEVLHQQWKDVAAQYGFTEQSLRNLMREPLREVKTDYLKTALREAVKTIDDSLSHFAERDLIRYVAQFSQGHGRLR